MNVRSKAKKPYDSVKKAVNQVRLNHILAVARDVLVREGYKKLTMRKVATEAGIAVGHLQHFFPSKEILLRGLFKFVSDEYIDQYDVILNKLSSDQPDKILGAIIEILLNSVSDDNLKAFFFRVMGFIPSQ